MATPQRPPRSKTPRDTSLLRDEIVERVTEKVTEKVSEKVAQKLDAATAKAEAKIKAASAKAGAKATANQHRLERDRARLERREQQHAHGLERLAQHLDALEVWTRSGPGGRRPRFSRDEIAATAVHLADTEGFESLSMRRLAAELGAGTMTLYHYVRTKDELLTLVNDAVMNEVVIPDEDLPLPTDWRAAITVIADRSRACLQRHPWILDIVDDPPIGPNAIRHFDQTMQAVSSLECSLEDRLDIATVIDEYVFGYCIHARNNLHDSDDGEYSEGLVGYIEDLMRTGSYPQLERLAEEHGVAETLQAADAHSRDPDRFHRNLARLLDGIEAGLR